MERPRTEPKAREPHPPWWRADQCAECDYDLRGLDIEGRCPECGLEIGKSVPLPVHAWPEGLRTQIAIGAMLTSLANLGLALFIGATAIWEAVRGYTDWSERLLLVFLTVLWTSFAAGWWLMARARRADLAFLRKRSGRRLAMNAWSFGLAGAILALTLLVMDAWRHPSDAAEIAASAAVIVAVVVAVASFLFAHVRALDVAGAIGERADAAVLRRWARVAKFVAIFGVIGSVGQAIGGAILLDVMRLRDWQPLLGYVVASMFCAIWLVASVVHAWAGWRVQGLICLKPGPAPEPMLNPSEPDPFTPA